MADEPATDDLSGEIEECLEEFDQFLGTLHRYPDTVVAMSLRIHLAALLAAMVDNRICSREDVHEFALALEQDASGTGDL